MKIKKVRQWCAPILLFSVFCAGAVYAEGKKDVSDPVLGEIISSFSGRMPKFIDKHGADIFVADGPVTRGVLMQAFYEYDKSLKIPKKDMVSKGEFDELRSELNQLAKSGAQSGAGGKVDISQVMNDLVPNMPMLLDNTLMNSKLFAELKSAVYTQQQALAAGGAAGGQQAGDGAPSKDISDLKLRVAMLEKLPNTQKSGANTVDFSDVKNRLAKLENSLYNQRTSVANVPASSKSSGNTEDVDARRELAKTQQELARLESKIDDLEGRAAETSRPAFAEGAQRYNSSALTKISLGLSMLAAFFIAR